MSKRLQTAIFFIVVSGVLIFLLMAPEGTTPRMPVDDDHPRRSRDYAACFDCHPSDTLPADHTIDGQKPPEGKQKCYFCHKQEEK